MKRLHALLELGAARLGWPGILGLGMLVFIGGFYVSVLVPQQQHVDALRQESLQVRQRAKLSVNHAPQAPAEQLAAFYDFFPHNGDLPDLLEKIFGAARGQALVLEQGEYRALKESAGRLMRYQITLPARGTYPQIRKFLDAAMAEVPSLSLDSIQF